MKFWTKEDTVGLIVGTIASIIASLLTTLYLLR
nr:MAG TPA: YtxH-like protein [Caudoviricetes sp.]